MFPFVGMPKPALKSAARALAAQLRKSLHRVDLQQVVSKYVGETEKNLGQLFRSADRSTSILLFDKADALFGKRTGVTDAHDRHADLGSSYLLERLGEYGVVVIALLRAEPAPVQKPRRPRLVVVKFPPWISADTAPRSRGVTRQDVTRLTTTGSPSVNLASEGTLP